MSNTEIFLDLITAVNGLNDELRAQHQAREQGIEALVALHQGPNASNTEDGTIHEGVILP